MTIPDYQSLVAELIQKLPDRHCVLFGVGVSVRGLCSLINLYDGSRKTMHHRRCFVGEFEADEIIEEEMRDQISSNQATIVVTASRKSLTLFPATCWSLIDDLFVLRTISVTDRTDIIDHIVATISQESS